MKAGQTLRATLAVAASACAYGSISPLTIVATERGMALPVIQSLRYGTAAILLLAITGWMRGRDQSASPPDALRAPWYTPSILFMAGGGQALVAVLALSALRWLPAATSAFLFYTYPAFVAVITAVRGIERLDRQRVIALLMALGGIAAMVGAPSADSLHPTGIVVILSGALVYALYIPLLDRLQRGRPPAEVALSIAGGGSILFLLWSVVSGTLFALPHPEAVGAGVLQGVLSVVAFTGFLAGLAALGPVRAAITSTIEPFWTTLLGIAMLGQPLGTGTLIGGAAIMVAVVLLQWRPSVPSPASDTRG